MTAVRRAWTRTAGCSARAPAPRAACGRHCDRGAMPGLAGSARYTANSRPRQLRPEEPTVRVAPGARRRSRAPVHLDGWTRRPSAGTYGVLALALAGPYAKDVLEPLGCDALRHCDGDVLLQVVEESGRAACRERG